MKIRNTQKFAIEIFGATKTKDFRGFQAFKLHVVGVCEGV